MRREPLQKWRLLHWHFPRLCLPVHCQLGGRHLWTGCQWMCQVIGSCQDGMHRNTRRHVRLSWTFYARSQQNSLKPKRLKLIVVFLRKFDKKSWDYRNLIFFCEFGKCALVQSAEKAQKFSFSDKKIHCFPNNSVRSSSIFCTREYTAQSTRMFARTA